MTDGVLPAGPAATEAGRHAQVSATQTVTGGDAALIAPLLVTFRFHLDQMVATTVSECCVVAGASLS